MKKKALFGILMMVIFLVTVPLATAQLVDAAKHGSAGKDSLPSGQARQEMEQQILSSTVRILMESWVYLPGEDGYDIRSSMGHGTVMNGRYLVTHNHFDLPMNIRSRPGDAETYVIVYLWDSSGEPIYRGPLLDYELVLEDEETLVFAHKDEGFFERLGFASAEFLPAASLPLEAGMTLAQVDWDGETTRVDWVMVQDVLLDQGTPRLVLADGATLGASGGGIFWNGAHVANNWRVEEMIGVGGDVIGIVTTVALDSAAVSNL